ncbi:MAG: hypothetical protein GF317_04995 [Candidatus Lokiarchaeota archaeon]|nr:hypothetical protein [Candidatus Lokiarchaeota archaeon]MBD3199162.1 hypothetical protein [Candidatus Lokiarchaeota archaeon]
MSDRLVELRVENLRLKKQVENLEAKILNLVGNIEINSTGGPDSQNLINNEILGIISKTTDQINVLTPKVDKFYANELIKLSQQGIAVLIITNDRSNIPDDFKEYFDQLKAAAGINVVTNPKVKYLLLFNTEEALYSGGSLVRKELEESILIVTKIKESSKLRKITEIFSLLLPSFMR